MHELAPLIKDLAVILGVAGLTALIFQKIGQPVVLGYLIAGLIIGPYTPPHTWISDVPSIKILSELGVIFLMFSLGLEFSFHKLMRVGFSAAVTGFIEVVFMLLIGLGVGFLLGWSYYNSLFLGAALAISSTTIIIKALSELNLKEKRFAELIFGILIVEDLLAIMLLVGLSLMVATKNIFSMALLLAGIKLILVVGGWCIVGYFVVPPIFSRIKHYINDETLTIIAVALCLLLVWMAASFHYSTALGAFIMGSILAETAMGHRIEHLISPICNLFAAVFFVSIGMLIDPIVIYQHFALVLLLSVVTIFGKVIVTSIGSFLTGQSVKTSVRVGFGMGQIGEFSFIIVGLGLTLSVIDSSLYSIIVAVSAITTFTTPYLIKYSDAFSNKLDASLSDRLQYFLDNYSAWVYRSLNTSQERPAYKKSLVRLMINGILVAIIFIVTSHWVLPFLKGVIAKVWLATILSWFIAMFIASPFIWGMLFAYKKDGFSLSPATFFCWAFTIVELAIVSIAYFHDWFIISIFIAVAIVFFTMVYTNLEKSYHWFEKRLKQNLQKKDAAKISITELAPWETHLVELIVPSNSPLSGKSLGQNQIREKFGVNIVAIYRDGRILLAPRGEEFIIPNDKLVILGNDNQIELFQQMLVAEKTSETKQPALGNFILKTILLHDNSLWVDKSIRDSKIREQASGIIVGLERGDVRALNPDPATVLSAGDLLFIVGERRLLEKL